MIRFKTKLPKEDSGHVFIVMLSCVKDLQVDVRVVCNYFGELGDFDEVRSGTNDEENVHKLICCTNFLFKSTRSTADMVNNDRNMA